MNKHSKLFTKRKIKGAWLRWQEIMHIQRIRENNARKIIKRMRNNMVSQAFFQYKETVESMVTNDINEGRTDEVIALWHTKTRRKLFNVWLACNHESKQQYRAFRVFLKWMINNQLKRFIIRWKDGSKRVEELQLLKKYQAVGDSITQDNQILA